MSDFQDEGWDYGYTDVPDDDMHSLRDEDFEVWEDYSDMLDDRRYDD